MSLANSLSIRARRYFGGKERKKHRAHCHQNKQPTKHITTRCPTQLAQNDSSAMLLRHESFHRWTLSTVSMGRNLQEASVLLVTDVRLTESYDSFLLHIHINYPLRRCTSFF